MTDLGLCGNEALAVVGWIAAQRAGAGGAIRPASRTTEAKYPNSPVRPVCALLRARSPHWNQRRGALTDLPFNC